MDSEEVCDSLEAGSSVVDFESALGIRHDGSNCSVLAGCLIR